MFDAAMAEGQDLDVRGFAVFVVVGGEVSLSRSLKIQRASLAAQPADHQVCVQLQ
jgi:hypothetical protein